jgi:hypothetical protein
VGGNNASLAGVNEYSLCYPILKNLLTSTRGKRLHPRRCIDHPKKYVKMSKKILITGAGTGLGEGASIGIARNGPKVIAAAQMWQQVTALRAKADQLGLASLQVENLNLLAICGKPAQDASDPRC